MSRFTSRCFGTLLVACCAVSGGGRAIAQPMFFSGAFTQDNDKALLPFSWPGGHAFIHSLGNSGGIGSQGDIVAPGGFDSVLSLFDSSGAFITVSDDFFGIDSYLSLNLPAGNYTAVLTQWDNYPSGALLSDGFQHDAEPNFASGYYGLQPTWAVDFSDSSPWTVARAKATNVGFIEGAVVTNAIDLIASASSASYQIQDATGGLTIFGSNAVINSTLAGVNEGDGVTIAGTFTTFSGLLELTPTGLNNDFGPVGVPPARVVASADLQDGNPLAEPLESMLVQLQNVHFTGIGPGQTFAGLTNYTVTDGTFNAVVRVPTGQLGMVGQLIPTGPINLRGILSQFDSSPPLDGGYQLLLTRASDIQPIPEPMSLGLALGCAVCGLAVRRAERR